MEPREAIESFKDYCDNLSKKYSTGCITGVARLGGGWAKEKFILEVSEDLDVLSTASLMYPYSAKHIFIVKREFTNFHTSKESAMADDNFTKISRERHLHEYRYDSGFWVPTKRIHQTVYDRETLAVLGEASWFDCVQKDGDIITFTSSCVDAER